MIPSGTEPDKRRRKEASDARLAEAEAVLRKAGIDVDAVRRAERKKRRKERRHKKKKKKRKD